MRPSLPSRFRASHLKCFHSSHFRAAVRPPLIRIQDGAFYRRHPSPNPTEAEQESNKPMFPQLDFTVSADDYPEEYWCIIGPSNAGKTTLLELLQGRHLCFPPTARTYPYLSTEELLAKDRRLSQPSRAIQYVGFNEKQRGLSGMGTYLSARFESRKEQTDFKVADYLRGRTQLNSSEEYQELIDEDSMAKVVDDLRLADLLGLPLSNLSNGQTRRARIAKALLGKPELLLLDEPFMGLDPPTIVQFNPLLRGLAYSNKPRLLLALRPQDPIPDYITHAIYLDGDLQVAYQGQVDKMTPFLDARVLRERDALLEMEAAGKDARYDDMPRLNPEIGRILLDDGIVRNPDKVSHAESKLIRTALGKYRAGKRSHDDIAGLGLDNRAMPQDFEVLSRRKLGPAPPLGEALLEMNGVSIKYGDRPALGDWKEQLEMHTLDSRGKVLVKDGEPPQQGLRWTVKRGQRWAVIGPNGSGKTTLLSLITSDHPLAYSAPMKIFGRSRLPQPGTPGLSLFEIQSRIGHSSPEIHSFFPRDISVRRTLESAWADTPLGKPRLDRAADARVDACLRWFREELNPALGPSERLRKETLQSSFKDVLEKRGPPTSNVEKNRRARSKYWYEFHEREEEDCEWADEMMFGDMTFSGQRVALFIRAIVAQPDIVILDEALSGMDDVIRDKCLLFLDHGERRMISPYGRGRSKATVRKITDKERRVLGHDDAVMTIKEGLTDRQALVVVSHIPQEIPRSVRDWLYLPTSGQGLPCIFGQAERVQLRHDTQAWDAIWKASELSTMSRDEYGAAASEEQQVRRLNAEPAVHQADMALLRSTVNQRLHALRHIYWSDKRKAVAAIEKLQGQRPMTYQSRTRLLRELKRKEKERNHVRTHIPVHERFYRLGRLDPERRLSTIVTELDRARSQITSDISRQKIATYKSIRVLQPDFVPRNEKPLARRDEVVKDIGDYYTFYAALHRHRLHTRYRTIQLRAIQAALSGGPSSQSAPQSGQHDDSKDKNPLSRFCREVSKKHRAIWNFTFMARRRIEEFRNGDWQLPQVVRMARRSARGPVRRPNLERKNAVHFVP